MPEGDTIHRTAARLGAALGDGRLTRFATPRPMPGPRPEPGDRAESVEARGKHLLIRFTGGATLHTHLGMHGSWRVSSPGDPPRGAHVRAVVETAAAHALCVRPSVIELLDDAGVRRHPVLRALGPDLCDPDPDLAAALDRMAALDPSTPVGVALLDQRVAAGIGNVYRSEVLWLCGADPFAPLAEVPHEARAALLRTAHDQLRRNLGPGPRRTVDGGLAVYDRAGRPCRRCGARVAVRRLGEHARATWWCPACQTPG